MTEPGRARGRPVKALSWVPLSWVLLAALVAYAVLIHYGLGPRPGPPLHPWSPRGFLTDALAGTSWEALSEGLWPGLLVFWLPALLLAGGCLATARSALLRAAAASAAAATGIFTFYAIGSDVTRFAWNFFQWRASLTMLGMAAVVGVVVASPWLAARWLRLGWPARLVWFLLSLFVVIALERNVTGTNPELRFAISPWPAVQVFGLEIFATIAAALLAGVGVAMLGLWRSRSGRAPMQRLFGGLLVVLGVLLPAVGLGLGWLPPRASVGSGAVLGGLCALGLALGSLGTWRSAERMRRRGVVLGVAALLLAVPLLAGQGWARWDYTETRGRRAQRIIDALQAYYERESVYPEDLESLVQSGDLASIPRARIGFAALEGNRPFVYQNFGTSYLLEFEATRWVQCAYNPPYDEEEDDSFFGDDVEEEDFEDDGLGAGSWSCPSKPPELW